MKKNIKRYIYAITADMCISALLTGCSDTAAPNASSAGGEDGDREKAFYTSKTRIRNQRTPLLAF